MAAGFSEKRRSATGHPNVGRQIRQALVTIQNWQVGHDPTRWHFSAPSAGYVTASGAVAQFLHARLLGAVVAAEHPVALLQAVADDAQTAIRAGGRELFVVKRKLKKT